MFIGDLCAKLNDADKIDAYQVMLMSTLLYHVKRTRWGNKSFLPKLMFAMAELAKLKEVVHTAFQMVFKGDLDFVQPPLIKALFE